MRIIQTKAPRQEEPTLPKTKNLTMTPSKYKNMKQG
jgi:hypothetical protein